MALYEVVLRQRYFEQLCISVFDYFSPGGIGISPTALELLTLMGFVPEGDPLAFPDDSVAGAIQGMQNTQTEYLSVEARELYSVSDFYEMAYSPVLTGEAASGDAMSPFVAYGLYTSRIRLDIRRSFKRFVGVSEGLVTAGGILTGGQQTVMDGVADHMSATLEGLSAFYYPCTLSLEKIPATEDDPVKYQLYETEAEQEEHIAQPLVWTPYTQVRSQTSRQYGRGA